MNNLPKVVTQQRRGRASNPRLLDRKSDALPLSHRATQRTDAFSALQVSRWCGILIDFLLTYLLYHRDSSVNSHLPPDQHLKCVQVEVRGLKVKPILPVYKQLIN